MMLKNSENHVPQMADLFPPTGKKQRKTTVQQKQRVLKRMLGEVILGLRPFLKVHSEVLQTDFWFVNEGLANPANQLFSGKVITMEMLADIMTDGQPVQRTAQQLSY
jgi:hypothetical protein